MLGRYCLCQQGLVCVSIGDYGRVGPWMLMFIPVSYMADWGCFWRGIVAGVVVRGASDTELLV